ncbi:hypothetical protein [Caldivirga maquilingensis]|uniref:Uncharacterized protein n=1 Tax=Caldivirga maquilingensis (strain ATCC 700844 / DSM 13496 / JCM 10307 / IC-167) TaxID=397948 RepID=A8M9L2_CALMQ|nr:hypothetical protein [Caldivirga maquilingensis]ABW00893.1 hypothetical protein Cmaq_0039 [Caldivirga maquilingensis IC-167]
MTKQRRVDCVYLLKLVKLLEDPFSGYYSDGYLNSEGMTILSLIAQLTIREAPWSASLFRKARERKDYQSVVKILEGIRELCPGSEY